MKITLRKIKSYYNGKNDLNAFTNEQLKTLDLKTIAVSYGVYGMNGGLFLDIKTSCYYIIPSRSTRLFQLV